MNGLYLNPVGKAVRRGGLAATAQGLKAVGHTPTADDREAAIKERTRLQVSQDGSRLKSRAKQFSGSRGLTPSERALTEML
jgi:hypothetical protein